MRLLTGICVLAFQVALFAAGHYDMEPPDAYFTTTARVDYYENNQMSWREAACEWGTQNIDATGGRFPESPHCIRVTEPAYTGSNSCNRREWAMAVCDWSPKREYWHSLCVKFDTTFPGTTGWNVFAQWKNSGDWWQFHLGTVPQTNPTAPLILRTSYGWGATANGGTRTHVDGGALPRNKWNDIIVHFKVNFDNASFLQIWLNGTQVIDYAGPIGYLDWLGMGNLKVGLYNSAMNAERIVYIDEMRSGATRADVEIRPGNGVAVQPRHDALRPVPITGADKISGSREMFGINGRSIRAIPASGDARGISHGIYLVRSSGNGAIGISGISYAK